MKFAKTITSTLVLLLLLGCGGSHEAFLRKVPRSERKGLAVLNYHNNTQKSRAPEFQPWEFGIASMIMTDVETIGLFNIISKEKTKDIIEEQAFHMSGMVDEKTMVKIGNMLGASYILAGSFMEMNGNLRIETQVFSVEKATQLGTASVTGKTDNFFELEKELFAKVSKFLDVMLTEEEQEKISSKVETKSVEASLNNYRGELAAQEAAELMKKGKKDDAKKVIETAKKDFQKALEYDPNYSKAKDNLSKYSFAIPVTF